MAQAHITSKLSVQPGTSLQSAARLFVLHPPTALPRQLRAAASSSYGPSAQLSDVAAGKFKGATYRQRLQARRQQRSVPPAAVVHAAPSLPSRDVQPAPHLEEQLRQGSSNTPPLQAGSIKLQGQLTLPLGHQGRVTANDRPKHDIQQHGRQEPLSKHRQQQAQANGRHEHEQQGGTQAGRDDQHRHENRTRPIHFKTEKQHQQQHRWKAGNNPDTGRQQSGEKQPPMLTRALRNALRPSMLLGFVKKSPHLMDPINVATATYRLVRLLEAEQQQQQPALGLTPAQQQQALTPPLYMTPSIQRQRQHMDEQCQQRRQDRTMRREAQAAAELLRLLLGMMESQLPAFEVDSAVMLLWSLAKLLPSQDTEVPILTLSASGQQQQQQFDQGRLSNGVQQAAAAASGPPAHENAGQKVVPVDLSATAQTDTTGSAGRPQPSPQLLQAIAASLSQLLSRTKDSSHATCATGGGGDGADTSSRDGSSYVGTGHNNAPSNGTAANIPGASLAGMPARPERPQHVLSHQHLCMAVWGAAKLGVLQEDSPLAAQLTSLVVSMAPSLTLRDTCTCMWSLTTAGLYDPVTFYVLSDRAEELLSLKLQQGMGPQAQMQQMRQGAGQPQQHPSDVSGATSPRDVDTFTVRAQDISNLVWSVASSRHLAPKAVELAAQAALPLLPFFSPQQLSNMAWGLATQGVLPPALLDGICRQALGVMEELDSRHLAQLLWAAAKHTTWRAGGLPQDATTTSNAAHLQQPSNLKQDPTPLQSAQQHPPQSSPDAANIAIGHVHVGPIILSFDEDGHIHPGSAAQPAEERPHTGTSAARQVSSSAVSVPKVSGASLCLFQAAQAQLTELVSTMSPPEACMISWAYAAAHVPAHALLRAVANHLLGLHQAGNLQLDAPSVATLLWSYARQGVVHEALLHLLFERASQLADWPPPGSTIMMLWALATLSHANAQPQTLGMQDDSSEPGVQPFSRLHIPPALVRSLAVAVHTQLPRLTGRELSNAAWALAELGCYHNPDLWDDMAERLLSEHHYASFAKAGIRVTGSGAVKGSSSFSTVTAAAASAGAGPTLSADTATPPVQPTSSNIERLARGRTGGTQGASRRQRRHVAWQVFTKERRGWARLKQQMVSINARMRKRRQTRGAAGVRGAEPECILDIMNELELAKLAWAYAKVGHVDEALLTGISDNLGTLAAEAPVPSAAAIAASNTSTSQQDTQPQGSHAQQDAPPATKSSSSRSGSGTPSLIQRREQVEGPADMQAPAIVPQQLPGGSTTATRKPLQPGVVVRTLWAFAMQGRHDDPLFEQLAPHALAILPSCQPYDVAALLWALASRYQAAGLEDEGGVWRQVLAQGLQAAATQAPRYRASELADVVWAAAVIMGGARESGNPGVNDTNEGGGHSSHSSSGGAAFSQTAGSSYLNSLLAHVGSHLAVAPPQSVTMSDLAAIAWALVRLRRLDPTLAACVIHHARFLLAPVTRQNQDHVKGMAIRADVGKAEGTSAAKRAVSMEDVTGTDGVGSPPAPLTGEDAESLATLLHSLVCMSCYDPALFKAAAPRLASLLDLLDAEQLAQLAWAYTATLQDATAAAAAASQEAPPVSDVAFAHAANSSTSNSSTSPPAASATIIAGSAAAVLDMSGPQPPPPGILQAHAQLLTAASAMLEAGAPRVPFGLTRSELHMLWQAHQCAQAWAAAAPALEMEAPAPAPAQPPPFQAPPALLSEASKLGSLDRASKPARRRLLVELGHHLQQMGYQTLSLSEHGPNGAHQQGSVEGGVTILQEAGPSWIGAVKVPPSTGPPLAVFVASKEDVWPMSSPGLALLSAEHAVTTRLLRGLGWQVVHLPAWLWNELGTPTLQAEYLRQHLNV